MTDPFDLTGTIAVVTGASGHLGPAMVAALAEAGATVHAVARNAERLAAAMLPLREAGLDVVDAPCDVTSPQWADLLSAVTAEHGRLDVLLNNAHIGHGGSLRTATEEQFDEAYALAVKSTWHGIGAARPGLRAAAAAGGSPVVVNVSSMYGLVAPDPRLYDTEEGRNPPYYGAVKAALVQLTRYAAAELGPEGIRVNSITPGPFPARAAQADPAFLRRLAGRTMLERIGRPDDLQTAVLFLASPASRFVTGINVPVDGGWTAW
ncbi:NAD(P)-dependent dehydrogenase, short-chain alcohol dehydrogenase family [Raineyella antarctica]|uniref:NAD(P)-dependent dehydrogenase, short-chain alcohol dehydrogenase family n=1 Tax=Raineyella antarctica TaxID=1577474 RepID=A0A1G6GF81_9ACTN|nr:SDR family oxidoreductase [Raineyella antarctica]SDB80624.1 NAD(P)-dependent dehydrogenase, short-chain alcohol dehydrogenase family [Raineyella antarctica]